MFNHVVPYRYLLPNMYLSVADIEIPYFLVCCCRTLISLDIARFNEEQCQTSSGCASTAFQKRKSGPCFWGREGSTQFAQGFTDRLYDVLFGSYKYIIYDIIMTGFELMFHLCIFHVFSFIVPNVRLNPST